MSREIERKYAESIAKSLLNDQSIFDQINREVQGQWGAENETNSSLADISVSYLLEQETFPLDESTLKTILDDASLSQVFINGTVSMFMTIRYGQV